MFWGENNIFSAVYSQKNMVYSKSVSLHTDTNTEWAYCFTQVDLLDRSYVDTAYKPHHYLSTVV